MKLKTVLLCLLALALLGCEDKTEVKNGELPPEFIPHVQEFLGTYQGKVERRATDLEVKMEGNRVVVTSTNDVLNSVCESSFGDLKEIFHKQKDGALIVTGVVFDFNPNLCSDHVIGRQMNLTFDQKEAGIVYLSYLDHYEEYERCDVVGGTPTSPPVHQCTREYRAYWGSGRFEKN